MKTDFVRVLNDLETTLKIDTNHPEIKKKTLQLTKALKEDLSGKGMGESLDFDLYFRVFGTFENTFSAFLKEPTVDAKLARYEVFVADYLKSNHKAVVKSFVAKSELSKDMDFFPVKFETKEEKSFFVSARSLREISMQIFMERGEFPFPMPLNYIFQEKELDIEDTASYQKEFLLLSLAFIHVFSHTDFTKKTYQSAPVSELFLQTVQKEEGTFKKGQRLGTLFNLGFFLALLAPCQAIYTKLTLFVGSWLGWSTFTDKNILSQDTITRYLWPISLTGALFMVLALGLAWILKRGLDQESNKLSSELA